MFFSYSWCFVAARAACGHTKLIKCPRSAKPQPEYRLAQGIFRKRPVTALCFCLHLTIGQSPLFMRVCEGRKICPRKFKICPTYFELCALYFFFSQRGVKNTFHVLTLCPAPDSVPPAMQVSLPERTFTVQPLRHGSPQRHTKTRGTAMPPRGWDYLKVLIMVTTKRLRPLLSRPRIM